MRVKCKICGRFMTYKRTTTGLFKFPVYSCPKHGELYVCEDKTK